MPKVLIFVTLVVLALGIWLVIGQGRDFERFGRQRERKVEAGEAAKGAPGREVELHGTITDASARPRAGLTVELTRRGSSPDERDLVIVDRCLTDERGRFSFRVDSAEPRLVRVLMPDGSHRHLPDLRPSTPLVLRLEPPPR